MNKRFFISNHCTERYVERVQGGVNTHPGSIFTEILKQLNTGRDITNSVYESAPRYILYLYQTYGKLGLTIIESGETIFICNKRPGAYTMYDVITCYVKHRYLEQFKNTVMKREDIFIKIKELKKKLKQ